jgi:phospholipase/lecithinase/hemolysin
MTVTESAPTNAAAPRLTLDSLCFDAVDPSALAVFWAAALGWQRTYDTADEVVLEPADDAPGASFGPLLFLRVPEAKAGKNRLHLDLRPADQAAEVSRLESLGARRTSVGQAPDVTWTVMADPDGNEFCVLRAPEA